MNNVTRLDIALLSVVPREAFSGVRIVAGGYVVDWTDKATPAHKAVLAKLVKTFDPLCPAASEVKAECARRIRDVASDVAQMNLASFAAAGLLTEAQKAAYAKCLCWVSAMRRASAELITSGEVDYQVDASWPVCPAGVAELVKLF